MKSDGELVDAKVYFVPPETELESELMEKYMDDIEAFPAVLLFHRKDQHHALQLITTLSGSYEVSEEMIRLHLLLRGMEELHMKKVFNI